EATAPPPTTAAAAQNAVAQQIGITESQRKAIERWQRQVVVHLSKFKRYPVEARAKRIEGDATISFAIDRFGRITRRDVVARSGSQVLDSAALAVLERAGNLPPPPAEVSGDTFDLVLPIEFRIKN
ncbi:MAG: energy transducer TonB, partial [Hyphomicrobiaceae bacterium]